MGFILRESNRFKRKHAKATAQRDALFSVPALARGPISSFETTAELKQPLGNGSQLKGDT